jgi:adenylate kinase family enzyme
MKVYHQSTAPLIESYRRLGLLISVPAGGSPEQIFARSLGALANLIR